MEVREKSRGDLKGVADLVDDATLASPTVSVPARPSVPSPGSVSQDLPASLTHVGGSNGVGTDTEAVEGEGDGDEGDGDDLANDFFRETERLQRPLAQT